jgi:hypothetical protein
VKLTSTAAIIVISLTMIGQANGMFLDGNDLYAKCTTSTPVERAICVGYVEGVLDAGEVEATLAWRQQRAKPPYQATLEGERWCAPDGITAGQAVDVVTAFLRNNPAVRQATADSLVAGALEQAWPCSR